MADAGLGTLDAQRLSKIPERYRAQHEFCFHLHDSMLRMFLDLAARKYPTIRIDFDTEEEAARFSAAGDPITYFIENDQREIAKELSVGQAMMATWSDFFNFVYEGLIALEKRKFVVSFALLRKPLKENLLFLTMMLVDDTKFFDGLEKSPATSFGHPGLQDRHRREYFTKAKQMIPFADFIDPEHLHDLIFDVANENGFAPLFDKATHLVTGRKQIETEKLNLNFIFKDPTQDDVYEWIYQSLSYVLLYAMLLQIELFRKSGFDSSKLSQWFSLTGLGSYSGLFLKGGGSVVSSMNRLLKPFLVCPHCDEPVKITKRGAARFFTAHKLTCRTCGHEHDFPLFWLLAKTKWSMAENGAAAEATDDARPPKTYKET